MAAIDVTTVAAVVAVSVWVAYRLRRDEGVDLSDEGYLWYGTQRVRAGEVPIRDFRAYEPARYRWCARLTPVVGSGPIGIRRASHLFVAPALALVVAGTVAAGGVLAGVTVAVALLAWSLQHFKLFDTAACLYGIVAVTAVVHDPRPATVAGAAAVALATAHISLNHALYLAAAAGAAGLVAWPGSDLATIALVGSATAGTMVGLAVPAVTALRHRGYLAAVVERRIRPMVSRGSTNMPRPVPWPWRRGALPPEVPTYERLGMGLVVLFLPLAPMACLVWVLVTRGRGRDDLAEAAVVAASMVSLAYTHHAFSRADISHVSQSVQPVVVALVAVAVAADSTVVLVGLLAPVAALWAALVLPHHHAWRRWRTPEASVLRTVGGDEVWQSVGSAAVIDATEDTLRRHGPDATLFAAPILPGLYAAVGVRTVTFDTFCIYPTPVDLDRAMADDVAGVDVAVVDLVALDGRRELTFSATHPETWRLLTTTFDEGPPLPGTRLFEARR